eukprot:CCRYP_001733-RA/>CCRYP_001733-RA protein AED:0.33 eAED:0.33 QI:146/1/1/1/1/1/4/36/729
MVEQKRGHPSAGGGPAPTKRQRKSAVKASKQSYFSSKPPSSVQKIDITLDQLMPQERIDLIADLSESILEDPTSAVSSSRSSIANVETKETSDDPSQPQPQYQKTQSKIQKLLDLASPSTNGHDAHAARLAMLSLLAIFQDILPSYRIRLPTEAEMAVRVSKEIKQTWDYERKLLQVYQKYLQLLERTWENGKSGNQFRLDDAKKNSKSNNFRGGGGPPTTLAATAILSLSQLLQTCYNFNFRSNILQMVVRQANNRSSDEVRSSCCNALATMFAKDVQGEASLEAVKRMAKMLKDGQSKSNHRGGRTVHPDLLKTWLALPLRVHEDEAIAANLATKVRAKKAKKSQQEKDMLEIEKELKEGDAVVDKIDLAKNQADILHNVTVSYFRILKECCNADALGDGKKKGNTSISELLPICLRGLAKFSHLIHIDAIVDLMAVLKELLKESQKLPLDAALHCILCALKTLKGPGRDMIPVDPKEYLIPLYNELSRLGVHEYQSAADLSLNDEYSIDDRGGNSMDKSIEAAIQCLDHAFTQRRELSASRLAAFLKRIVSTSLHCPPHSSTPLVACARQMALRYSTLSKVQHMLENEEDIVAEGMFSPNAEDPEHANAHATSLWELSLLQFHVHPMVADHSLGMAENKFLKLPGESPGAIGTVMGRNAKEGYILHKATLKRHPLEGFKAGGSDSMFSGNERKKKRQRRNQSQIRFITPRKTSQWHLLPANSISML